MKESAEIFNAFNKPIDMTILDHIADLSIKINTFASSLREFEKQCIDPKFEEIQSHINDLEQSHGELSVDNDEFQHDALKRLLTIENFIGQNYADEISTIHAHIAMLKNNVDFNQAKDLIYQGAQTHASILRCEAKTKELEQWINQHQEEGEEYGKEFETRDNEILARIKELERFQDITHAQYMTVIKKQQPHKCPVCDGCACVLTGGAKGDFDGMLRADLTISKSCNACEGKGIVWG